jgi:hypothetical protein
MAASAFAPPRPTTTLKYLQQTQRHYNSPFRTIFVSLLAAKQDDDFDDFGSSVGGNEDTPTGDGQALASEFYQQLREREEQDRKDEEVKLPLSEEDARFVNRKPFSRRQEVQAGQDVAASQKFTGRSAGLFTGRGASVFSVPSSSAAPVRQRMMQNELSLVGRAERTLVVQIVATLGLLFFALYIGWSGGIAANSNDWNNSIPNLDTSLEGMDAVLPVPTDTEASVWL